MSNALPELPTAKRTRAPRTEEERRRLRDLDEEAFGECVDLYEETSRERDPAYLRFAARRMFFNSFCKFHTIMYCI
jgi:hypothetical protein